VYLSPIVYSDIKSTMQSGEYLIFKGLLEERNLRRKLITMFIP